MWCKIVSFSVAGGFTKGREGCNTIIYIYTHLDTDNLNIYYYRLKADLESTANKIECAKEKLRFLPIQNICASASCHLSDILEEDCNLPQPLDVLPTVFVNITSQVGVHRNVALETLIQSPGFAMHTQDRTWCVCARVKKELWQHMYVMYMFM